MAKLNNALDILNRINENTEETNKSIKDLILQNKKQADQEKRDKTLEDAKDKKSPIIKALGMGGGAAKAIGEKSGVFGKLKEMLGLMAGLAGISALTSLPDLLKNFDVQMRELVEMVESTVRTIATLPVIKALVKKPTTPKTPPAPDLDPRKGNYVDQEAKGKAKTRPLPIEPDLDPRKGKYVSQEAKAITQSATLKPIPEPKGRLASVGMMADEIRNAFKSSKQSVTAAATTASEVDRFSRAQQAADFNKAEAQKIAKAALSKSPTVMTEMGELKMNEKTMRFQNVETGKMVKTDDALKAIQAVELPTPQAPSRPPSVDVTAPKKPGVLSRVGDTLNNIPGMGYAKAGAKIVGKVAAPVGVAIDAGLGIVDKDFKSAGYGVLDRGGLGLVEGIADVGDFGANLLTGLGGMFSGKGFKEGYQNEIDMSKRFKDFAISEKGKYLLSMGKLGSLDPEGSFAEQRKIKAGDVAEATVMSQAFPASTLPSGAPSMPLPNAKLQRSVERNALISEIIKAQDPQRQDQLLTKLEELITAMTSDEQIQSSMIINQVNQNTSSGTVPPLSVDIPNYD